jgi:hypothetical protein
MSILEAMVNVPGDILYGEHSKPDICILELNNFDSQVESGPSIHGMERPLLLKWKVQMELYLTPRLCKQTTSLTLLTRPCNVKDRFKDGKMVSTRSSCKANMTYHKVTLQLD